MENSTQRKRRCRKGVIVNILFAAVSIPLILLLYFSCEKEFLNEKKFSEEMQREQEEESQEKMNEISYEEEIEEVVSVLKSDEREQLQQTAKLAAEECADLYKDIKVLDTTFYQLEQRTKEQRREVVSRIGGLGFVSVSKGINMANYEKVEIFYSEYSDGKDAQVTIYEIYGDGRFGCRTFLYRAGKLQVYYVEITWQEGGVPILSHTSVWDLEEIRLTEKGYFIYTNKIKISHGNLREHYRIKPLAEDCRALTEKYISGLSYIDYNLLTVDWNSSNVEQIIMDTMFGDIYHMHTGEYLKVHGGRVGAEIFEEIMTIYFPITVEQLHHCCGYDADSDTYECDLFSVRPYAPFGEVVDYTENEDGTLTLFVDGVWPDYAFTNQVVIQSYEDGTFCYLSNVVEQQEMEIPVIKK
jgi:flagellar motility protein MotE (MotC chaperone)